MAKISGQSVVRSDFSFTTTTRRGPGPRTHNWDELVDGEVREVLSMGLAKVSTFKALLWRAAKQRGKKVRTQIDPAVEVTITSVSSEGNVATAKTTKPNKFVRAGHEIDVAEVSEDAYNGHFTVVNADEKGFSYELAGGVKDLPDGKGGTVARGPYLFVQGYVPEPGEVDEDEATEGVEAGAEAEAEADNGDAKEEVTGQPVAKGRRRSRR